MDPWSDPDFIRDELEVEGRPLHTPRVFDKVLVNGEQLPILIVENGQVITTDDAGKRIEIPISRLVWNEEPGCWADRIITTVTYLRCSTCGVLIDGLGDDCRFCGEVFA